MAAKIKKGDYVQVISGSLKNGKGKKGEVLQVFPNENRVIVAGVNLVKRHMRPSQSDPEGGIKTFEAPIHISNVAHLDPKDGKPTRVGFKTLKNGNKVRVAKRSGEVIDD
ncbi:MAG TPA: 50S ribosomal protein L24 [Hellea balneolensis]|uniref:Large ribosomal subunit protein uL24 n=1 Tax=Hellea balneolensis TaxID=287478 RepID=A0A7C5R780_9PROT|nr:50S ribosomal protein L24 [Hellea balneolensis]